jgi:AcrR family transcriptional regulator
MIRVMKSPDTSDHRQYDNSLRAEQAQQTRERILEGLIRTMARGITELSIPASRATAGVSVPTVYRNFRTKQELVQAMLDYVRVKAGFEDLTADPTSVEGLVDLVVLVFGMWDRMDDTLRAAMLSEFGQDAHREELVAERTRMIDHSLASIRRQIPDEDYAHLRNVLVLLCSSHTLRFFKNYLGLSAMEAGQSVAWAVRVLTQPYQTPPRPPE